MAKKFDWESIFQKLENTQDYKAFIQSIEPLLFSNLNDKIFEVFLRELHIQTRYMTNEQKDIWIIYKYLSYLLSEDVNNFSKEINLNKLSADLLLKKYKEEKIIIENVNYTSIQKDILLEDLERRYNDELKILSNTYPDRYKAWANNHANELREYGLIKTQIEAWFKAYFKKEDLV